MVRIVAKPVGVRKTPLDQIVLKPYDIGVGEHGLEEAAESIQLGLFTPLVVLPRSDGKYSLVHGCTRFSCHMIGDETTLLMPLHGSERVEPFTDDEKAGHAG